MPKIKFGVGIYGTENAREAVELARRADELGYGRFWIGDSHMIWRELYVLAGAIAMATKNIQIGPGVTHPAARHLTVTASAMATLHELTEGRVMLGFGVGASGPANIGMKPASVGELETHIQNLRRLLRGEAVPFNGTDVKCLFAANEIPIYIGTRAPQAMKLACRLTAGFIHAGASDRLAALVAQIRGYTKEAGRKPQEVEFVYRLPCAIDDDPAKARAAVKGVVARTAMTQLGRLYDHGKLADEEDRRAIERMRQEYDTYRHMDAVHSHLLRDEWLGSFALAGTPEQVRAKVKNYIAAGIDELTIIPCGNSRRDLIETFASEIIAKL